MATMTSIRTFCRSSPNLQLNMFSSHSFDSDQCTRLVVWTNACSSSQTRFANNGRTSIFTSELILDTHAYNLLNAVRDSEYVPAELRNAQPARWRTRLIKVTARVIQSTRRIVLEVSSSWPHWDQFTTVSKRTLRALEFSSQTPDKKKSSHPRTHTRKTNPPAAIPLCARRPLTPTLNQIHSTENARE